MKTVSLEESRIVSQEKIKNNGHSLSQNATHDLDKFVSGELHKLPPCLPEGDDYIVAYERAEYGHFQGKDRVFFWFTIAIGEHQGQQLCLACPLPKQNASGTRKFGLGSKYVEVWCLFSGQSVKRADRLSTRVFQKGSYFRAAVKTVRKDQWGKERPPQDYYSKIERLIERAAGAVQS